MRKLACIIIIILLLASATAEKITLKPMDSYSDEDKNITLLKLENKKALVCINNQKGIVPLKQRTAINGAAIEMRKFSQDSANFDIAVPNCYKCECKDDCLNLLCTEPKSIKQENIENQTQQEKKQEAEKTEIIEPTSVSHISIIAVALIVLVGLLGIWVLWKKVY